MRIRLLSCLGFCLATSAIAQVPAAQQLTPNLAGNIERPLRYHPEGEDFVIVNGGEFFNRPLYGGNTAFRVDAGDKPEFVLYLPGRGGNLRLGLRSPAGAKWLHEAATIEARYRPGEMLYEICDPLLGANRVLRVAAVVLPNTEALAVRLELAGGRDSPASVPAANVRNTNIRGEVADEGTGIELVVAYGGASGKRGRRDGDIGTENVPIGEWFQVKPEDCAGDVFQAQDAGFVLQAKTAVLRGTLPAGTVVEFADATRWSSCAELLAARGAREGAVVAVGTLGLLQNKPVYLGVQRVDGRTAGEPATDHEATAAPAEPGIAAQADAIISPGDWPRRFAAAEGHFAALRSQVRVDTPDPWLNAAVGALNVAADAVWDEPQQAIMHGAIAWRTKLLGWRGPFALDALGWTDRARANFRYWAGRQNTSPIPDRLPPPDAAANFARNEAGLHSNGDLSNSHYDMNLVFIDALFRHLLWTGDTAFAKEMWPVIERHLAWERRLFRREFSSGGATLPLYEAYAAIWASDDLQYSGGGTAHASAYNFWHNRMAARIAPLAGADGAPYAREADAIAEGMRKLLWVGPVAGGDPDADAAGQGSEGGDAGYRETTRGHFAEAKDWLGNQLVHPSAGLWTFYHAMDSGLPNAEEADAMADDVLRSHSIPVRGPGVPADAAYAMLPSTDWLPYTWSLNNVVLGENVHTALGLWQAGRAESAFALLKSSLLASMYLGICPGNVGSMNYLDVYRRESQRDFADGSGVLSRALVEGLFGVRPDALQGVLQIEPGFPRAWARASIVHPALDFTFSRQGNKAVYRIVSRSDRFRRAHLVLPALSSRPVILVNGRNTQATSVARVGEESCLAIDGALGEPLVIEIEWAGSALKIRSAPERKPPPQRWFSRDEKILAPATVSEVDLSGAFNDRVTEIFHPGKYLSPRSPFVSLALPSQGIGYWAGHVDATAEIDDRGLRETAAAHGGHLRLPNGVSFTTPGPAATPNIIFTSQWDNYPREATVPIAGKARRVHLLMAGSTNAMQSRIDNGEVVVTYRDGTQARLALRNPETWWPIEQDYFTDDFQFRIAGPLPTRVDLRTGRVRVLEPEAFKGKGRVVPGGAATVLALDLDSSKELRSLTVRALANDVVIGLMAATFEQ